MLCIDDLPSQTPFPSTAFALVDHNRLLPPYTKDNPAARVTAIIDHHADEGQHINANPRVVRPAGSCSSLVTTIHCPDELPSDLATLLFSAILIDTGGLKVGGKALDVDRAAAAYLIPRSSFAETLSQETLLALGGPAKQGIAGAGAEPHTLTAEELQGVPLVKDLAGQLAGAKFDLSALSTPELLRRDYKEYNFALPWERGTTIKAGLATVPRKLKKCEDVVKWSMHWMAHRGLTVFGVLTSFEGKPKPGKSKGKHKREQLWFVRDGSGILEGFEEGEQVEQVPQLDLKELAHRLWEGLEDSKVLDLEKHKKFKVEEKGVPKFVKAKVYLQGNANATRKATAPLLKTILEGEKDEE